MAKDVKEILSYVKDFFQNLVDNRGMMSIRAIIRAELLWPAPGNPLYTVGWDWPLMETKDELLKGGSSVLLLSGLPGTGTMTMARKLCWDPDVKGKFTDNIFFVQFSRIPNFKSIVQTLFGHCGHKVAINLLEYLLNLFGGRPTLLVLILDDFCPCSKTLVEKFRLKQLELPDYKIVVRPRIVFPKFLTSCCMEPLDHDDAVELFYHIYLHSRSYTPFEESRFLVDFSGNNHLMLSFEISPAGHDLSGPPLNVHPLPLPPGAPMVSCGNKPSPTKPKPEPSSMKSQWHKGKRIGSGAFGRVYVATNRETGIFCAMKEADICLDDPKSAERIKHLQQEISILSHLKHTNIVQYYGSEIIEDQFYIYLEYVHLGSIDKRGAMAEYKVRYFTRHILLGLAYLHSKRTIHRDIKGANLLVDSTGVVKLADFGLAKHLIESVMQKDNSSDLAFAVDIWSLGCTIIEMFTGKPPWSEYEGVAAMFKVLKDTPPIPETLSPEGKDFLRCCFKRNPAERPTASALLEHRFLKNPPQPDVS